MMSKYVQEYTFRKYAVCRVCQGSGEEVRYERELEEDGFRVKEKPVRRSCPRCEGSGLVEVIREVRVTVKAISHAHDEAETMD